MTDENKTTETDATPQNEPVSKADDIFREMRPTVDVRVDELYETVQKSIEGARSGETIDKGAIHRSAIVMKQAVNCPDDDSPTLKVDAEYWAAVQKDAEGHDVGRMPPTKKLEDVAKRWNESTDDNPPTDQPATEETNTDDTPTDAE